MSTVTSTVDVTGMTCQHCVAAVTQELSALDGVQQVHVDLVAGGRSQVTVTSRTELAPDAVRAAVEEAGYVVADD